MVELVYPVHVGSVEGDTNMPATPADNESADLDFDRNIMAEVTTERFFRCHFCFLIKPNAEEVTDKSSGDAICLDCAHDFQRPIT